MGGSLDVLTSCLAAAYRSVTHLIASRVDANGGDLLWISTTTLNHRHARKAALFNGLGDRRGNMTAAPMGKLAGELDQDGYAAGLLVDDDTAIRECRNDILRADSDLHGFVDERCFIEVEPNSDGRDVFGSRGFTHFKPRDERLPKTIGKGMPTYASSIETAA